MIVILMLKYVPLSKQSNTFTSTYTRATIAPLWNFRTIKTGMRSRSIWILDISDQSKVVGIYWNFLCMQKHQTFIDFLFIWRASIWCTSMLRKILRLWLTEVLPRRLLLLLGLK